MKKKIRNLAFTVSIMILVLSVFCFIWSAYSADSYYQAIVYLSNRDDIGISLLDSYRRAYALYICVSLSSLLIVLGTVFLFIYILKNDFSLSKSERLILSQQKQERKINQRKEKLRKQLEELESIEDVN